MSIFLTFEGGEGAGKSTQVASLTRRLEESGRSVVKLREPGGTPFGDEIYALLQDPSSRRLRRFYKDWVGAPGEQPLEPLAELFLFEAARTQLVAQEIAPALKAGQIVVCDRFTDSTTAYQGYGRGLALDIVMNANSVATGGLAPSLTFLLDIPPEDGLKRSRGAEHRMEQQGLEFHERVRQGYLEIAASNADRFMIIDACDPAETVGEAIWQRVKPLLPPLPPLP